MLSVALSNQVAYLLAVDGAAIGHGYDINLLGHARISGFQQTLKAEVEAGLVFHQGPRAAGEKRRLISGDDSVPTETILEMQHKIDYLEQEIEFLKKIMSGKKTGKQV